MLSFPATPDTWRTVFTAVHTGLYAFGVSPTGTSFRVFRGSTVVLDFASGATGTFALLLQAGDVLEEEGRAIDLYSVRLGDEL